jgi:RimJ/RimL family protein N-acetyltransferase
MILVHTERLFLRHFHVEDEEPLLRGIFADAEVMKYGDGVQTSEWTRAWLQTCLLRYQTWGFGPYAVVEGRTHDVIGYCGLFHFTNVNGKSEVEIGYRLRRTAWGRGYATEAARAVRDYAFDTLGLTRLIAMIDPANLPSIRVAEKIGMKYEQDVLFDGYDHPDHVYVVMRSF